MNNNSSNNGPYKHFKRPKQGRAKVHKVQKSSISVEYHWIKWVIGLVILVLIAVHFI